MAAAPVLCDVQVSHKIYDYFPQEKQIQNEYGKWKWTENKTNYVLHATYNCVLKHGQEKISQI